MSPDTRLGKVISGAAIWLPWAVFFLAVIARLVPGPRTIDDSYITFRYARNILAGNGFVYNPGEQVLGTTTPLYTLLLSSLAAFMGGAGAPFPGIALAVNAIADGISCVLLLYLGRRLGSPLAGIGAALVWAIAPFSVTFAIGGLETSVYVLMLLAIFTAYLKQKYILTWLFAGFALLTRPDALVLIVPLGVDRLIDASGLGVRLGKPSKPQVVPSRSTLWIELLAFAIPVVLWVTFAIAYFGSPLPHSILAKSVAYRLPKEAALVRLLQHYAVPFLGNLTFGNWWIGVGVVLAPFTFLVGAIQAIRRERHTWPFAAYPWLYFAAFSLANPLIFRWYLTPPLPFYMLMILIGIDALVIALLKRKSSEGVPSHLTQGLGVILVVCLPILLAARGWSLIPDHGLTRPAPDMAWYQLELLYRRAAGELAKEIQGLDRPAVLAAGDVGVLGFYTGAHILDTVGLNSPVSTGYYPLDSQYYTISYAVPPELILDQQPDYVVILEVYGREGLLKDARFEEAYQLREKIPTDIYGSDGMLIFQRRPEE